MMNTCFSKRQKAGIAKKLKLGMINTFPGKNRQRQFAVHLGVSPATVYRWITGKTTPDIEHLLLASKILNIPLHKLCGFSGKRSVKTKNIVFDNVMNLSIVAERAACTANGIRRATNKVMKKIGDRLEGLTKRHDSSCVRRACVNF